MNSTRKVMRAGIV